MTMRTLPDFDIDYYRLIARHLTQPEATRNVIEVPRDAVQPIEW
jgi:hypothetical protein